MTRATIIVLCTLVYSTYNCASNNNEKEHQSHSKEGVRIVKNGLSHPWEIIWGSDNHIWMTERDGRVSRIDPLNGNTSFSYTINEVESRGEGGLLGMALDPDFLHNGFLYVVYDYNKSGSYTEKLVRYTYDQNKLSNPKVLLDNVDAAGIHNGSRLWIEAEAQPKIYMSTGDASEQSLPQKTNTVNGKILRINLDGTIPADNPFPNNPVWSYGHRNPQGIIVANGIMYASEHGPSEEDEINIIEKGRNYGWPEVTGPCKERDKDFCALHNVKDPIWSSGNNTIAVCGLDYYNKEKIPQWKNSLLMVTLKNSSLRQLKLSDDHKTIVETKTWFAGEWGRLRDICISPDGKVYLCSSNGSDDVLVEISKL